jgi:hypothetical protein
MVLFEDSYDEVTKNAKSVEDARIEIGRAFLKCYGCQRKICTLDKITQFKEMDLFQELLDVMKLDDVRTVIQNVNSLFNKVLKDMVLIEMPKRQS